MESCVIYGNFEQTRREDEMKFISILHSIRLSERVF